MLVVEYRDSKQMAWRPVKAFRTREAAEAYERCVSAGLPSRVVIYVPEDTVVHVEKRRTTA